MSNSNIRLTIDLEIEPELPNQWSSRCRELDVMSAGRTPEVALEAVAKAVRMLVKYEAKRCGLSTVEAFEAIRLRALRREASTMTPPPPKQPQCDLCERPAVWMHPLGGLRCRDGVRRAQPTLIPKDVVPRINGQSFRCDCGCNVFRHPEGEPLVFVCNACGDRYRGEP